jgi:alanine racemase
MIPMVKADAYGLGMAEVSRALARQLPAASLHGFGVAAAGEALALRAAGWQGTVVVFTPLTPDELPELAAAGVTIAASSAAELAAWQREGRRLGRALSFHLEVDSGMGRAGVRWDEAAALAPALGAASAGLRCAGVFTHFHSADEPGLPEVALQWERFQGALEALRAAGVVPPDAAVHACNSAAALLRPELAADLVRPGIFLYGGGIPGAAPPLPVVRVAARLVRVQEVQEGASVGYGATHRAAAGERWGTVAIGYGDGLFRRLAEGGGRMLLRGRSVPIRGRISMDVTVVDLSHVPGAEVGDEVIVIGRSGKEEITVDEVARLCGTISYEVLTSLGARLPRIHSERGGDDAGRDPGAGAESTEGVPAEERPGDDTEATE